MSRPLFIKKAGEQKAVTDAYIKQNGEFKKIKLFFTKKNGEWVHKHEYDEAVTKNPTCTTTGIRTYTCPCKESYTETIAKSPHTVVIDPAKAATCTSTGLTEGKHCPICGTVITAQTTIAQLPHTYETTYTKTVGGYHIKKVACSVCGSVSSSTKEAHTYMPTIEGGEVERCIHCNALKSEL